MMWLCNGIYFFFGLLLPTQLGKHFWPSFSFVHGVRVDYFAPTIYVTTIFLLILTLLQSKRIGVLLIQLSKKAKLVILTCLALTIVGTFLSPFPLLSLYRISQYALLLFALVITITATENQRRIMLWGLFGSSIYMLIVVIFQFVFQSSIQGPFWLLGERSFSLLTPGVSKITIDNSVFLRPYGTFSHPNAMGGFFGLVALLLSPLSIFASIPALAIVLFSFSRSAILATAICFSALLFIKKRGSSCIICRVVPAFLFLFLIFVPFLWKGSTTSLIERIVSIQSVATLIIHNPTFLPIPGDYLVPVEGLRFTGLFNQPIHNVFLILLLEWRVTVIFLCIALLLLLKHKSTYWLLIALFIGITGFFDHYWLTQQQTMLLLGITIGFGISSKTTEKSL